MGKNIWMVLGGIAAGAAGASYLIKNKDKLEPMAAEALAKAMSLGEDAAELAGKAKEQATELAGKAKDQVVDWADRAGVSDYAAKAKDEATDFAAKTRDKASGIYAEAKRIKAENDARQAGGAAPAENADVSGVPPPVQKDGVV